MFNRKKDKTKHILVYHSDYSSDFSEAEVERLNKIINAARDSAYNSDTLDCIKETLEFVGASRFQELLNEGLMSINFDYWETLYNTKQFLLVKKFLFNDITLVEEQISIAKKQKDEYEQKALEKAEQRWKKTGDNEAIFVYTGNKVYELKEIDKLKDKFEKIAMDTFEIVGGSGYPAKYITRAIEAIADARLLVLDGYIKIDFERWKQLYRQGDYFLVSYIIERDLNEINKKIMLEEKQKAADEQKRFEEELKVDQNVIADEAVLICHDEPVYSNDSNEYLKTRMKQILIDGINKTDINQNIKEINETVSIIAGNKFQTLFSNGRLEINFDYWEKLYKHHKFFRLKCSMLRDLEIAEKRFSLTESGKNTNED